MKHLKSICALLVMFLIIALSISFAGLPILLSILLGSWYWLFLYSIHLLSIVFIGIGCATAPQTKEDSSYD